ncbi:MAG TPA: efflux RND transporter periplasmic adaptor subunit [Bryobacteraceae bacterium]|nr:efflux RND transporter periplasmic adaptor subunit [Bryobacteraceae bacterium]
MRFRIILPAIVVASLSLASSCGRAHSPADDPAKKTEQAQAPLSQIKVEPVTMLTVPVSSVQAPGKVEANPGTTSKVALPMQGRVTKVMVTVGDSVRQGMPLIVLDSPDTDAAVSDYREAVAKRISAQSNVAKSEADLSRAQDLLQHGAVPQKEVLSANAQLTQSRSELAGARAEEERTLRKLRIFGIQPDGNSDEITVRAPVSGKVLDLSITPGEYRNDTSAPVMTIADLSNVYMTADVPETSIRFTSVNDRVTIRLDAYPDQQFTGRVTKVGDTVDPATRTIKVRVLLQNPDGKLRPDMFGQLDIEGPSQDVVTAPTSAIVQTESAAIVYRERARGEFDPVQVKLGDHVGNRTVILKGLSSGDRIVTDGPMLIRSKSE